MALGIDILSPILKNNFQSLGIVGVAFITLHIIFLSFTLVNEAI